MLDVIAWDFFETFAMYNLVGKGLVGLALVLLFLFLIYVERHVLRRREEAEEPVRQLHGPFVPPSDSE